MIRHGDPDYAHDTLTEKGWREAEALTQYLLDKQVDHWYCSPLGRARDTIAATLQQRGQAARTLPFLKEFDAPMPDPETGVMSIPWDFYPEVWTKEDAHFDAEHWQESSLFRGTSVKEVYDWVCRSLDELLEQHGYVRDGRMYRPVRPNQETIGLVCHFGVTSVMLSHLLNIPMPVAMQGLFVAPTSMTMVETEERLEGAVQFRLRYLGATPHLLLAGEPVSASGMFREVFTEPAERLNVFKD